MLTLSDHFEEEPTKGFLRRKPFQHVFQNEKKSRIGHKGFLVFICSETSRAPKATPHARPDRRPLRLTAGECRPAGIVQLHANESYKRCPFSKVARSSSPRATGERFTFLCNLSVYRLKSQGPFLQFQYFKGVSGQITRGKSNQQDRLYKGAAVSDFLRGHWFFQTESTACNLRAVEITHQQSRKTRFQGPNSSSTGRRTALIFSLVRLRFAHSILFR